jgi:hypothetical protein
MGDRGGALAMSVQLLDSDKVVNLPSGTPKCLIYTTTCRRFRRTSFE